MTISPWPSFAQSVQDYFLKHLINQKNASSQTIASYRDTMRLLLKFLKRSLGREPSQLEISDVGADEHRPVLELAGKRTWQFDSNSQCSLRRYPIKF